MGLETAFPLPIEPQTAAKVAVSRLALTDFRCYGAARLETDDRPVVLTGSNGAGKTNLLEALSFLVPGRGLRRARLDEVTRHAAGPATGRWAVSAVVTGSFGETEIGTGMQRDGQATRRIVRINGANAAGPVALAEWTSALWLTPEMDRLFTDAASSRRRFLDRLVLGCDPAHAQRLNDYGRAMQERNRLLRARGVRGADPAWLDGLEQRMAETGVAVAAARVDLVSRLGAALTLGIGPFPAARLVVEGEVEQWMAEMSALQAEDRFRDRLGRARAIDAEAGRATAGTHRSDLIVTRHADGAAASSCSTGEQKALLISVILAEARLQAFERGTVPLLLLDEIAAHLDADRRAALFDEICALNAQAWMTGTDEALFEPLADRGQHFRVDAASVTLR